MMRPILDVANHHKCKYLKIPGEVHDMAGYLKLRTKAGHFYSEGHNDRRCLPERVLAENNSSTYMRAQSSWNILDWFDYRSLCQEGAGLVPNGGPKYCSKTLKPTKLSRDSPNRTILGHYQAEVVGGYEVYQNSIRVEEKVASCLCWNDRRSV